MSALNSLLTPEMLQLALSGVTQTGPLTPLPGGGFAAGSLPPSNVVQSGPAQTSPFLPPGGGLPQPQSFGPSIRGTPTTSPFQTVSTPFNPAAQQLPPAAVPPRTLNKLPLSTEVAPTVRPVDPRPLPDPNAAIAAGASVVSPTSQIPTGLLGAEQALGTGAVGSIDALLEGLGIARGDLDQSTLNALAQLTGAGQAIGSGTAGGISAVVGGTQGALDKLGVARRDIGTGTQGGIGTVAGAGIAGLDEIGTGVSRGTGFLQDAERKGLRFLGGSTEQAVAPLTGFQQAGEKSTQLQAALLGALGPEAQAQAIREFQDSPGQAFLQEEQERAILRNAAATGGVGGGRVRQELARQAAGRAEAAFGNRINQLSGISGQGVQAAGQISNIFGAQGQAGANLINKTGSELAQLAETGGLAGAELVQNAGSLIANLAQTGAISQAQIGTIAAQIEQQAGNSIADLSQSAGFAQADIGTKAALIEQQTGTNLAQLAQQTGKNVSQILTDLGSDSAQLRSQAGRDLAAAISETSTGLAALQESQGAGISDVIGSQVANIGNLLVDAGLVDAGQQQQLATILANLSVGEGSVAANVAANIGNINAAGILGQNTAMQTAISDLGKILGNADLIEEIFE